MVVSPIRYRLRRVPWLAGLCLAVAAQSVQANPLVPEAARTFADGRRPVGELYAAYQSLEAQGWQLDIVAHSRPQGTEFALPVIALRTREAGEAVWILSGIHGEETAGPNAIAGAVEIRCVPHVRRQRVVRREERDRAVQIRRNLLATKRVVGLRAVSGARSGAHADRRTSEDGIGFPQIPRRAQASSRPPGAPPKTGGVPPPTCPAGRSPCR